MNKVRNIILLFLLAGAGFATANTDTRTWKLVDKVDIRAELTSYDADTQTVTLLRNDKQYLAIPLADFSASDKAWILEWTEIGDHIFALGKKLGGTLDHLVFTGDYQTDAHIYYPSTYDAEGTTKLPLLILFNASGKAFRYLHRHMEAAEEAGFIVVALGQFRNTGDDPVLEGAFLQRFKEVFPAIQRDLMFDEKRVFMGGNSGGAWRAYHYTAWVEYPWAGIYANCGWLGGPKYQGEDYADDMRVAMVNGHGDWSATVQAHKDTPFLKKHNAEITVISFEGGHQIPPVHSQIKAFKWLLQSEVTEEQAEATPEETSEKNALTREDQERGSEPR